jgi:hypothetical protein
LDPGQYQHGFCELRGRKNINIVNALGLDKRKKKYSFEVQEEATTKPQLPAIAPARHSLQYVLSKDNLKGFDLDDVQSVLSKEHSEERPK